MGFLDRLRRKDVPHEPTRAAPPTPTRAAAPRPSQAPRVPYQFAFVDVETTGLDSRVHRIIEIGIVIVDDQGTTLDEWCSLVRPDGDDAELTAGPTRIHLIETEWLQAAPTFRDLLPQIAHRLNGRIIVAHNAQFDIEFLAEEFARAGFDDEKQGKWVTACTLDLCRSVDIPRRLDRACFDMGIKYEKHTALDDARASSMIVRQLGGVINPQTFVRAGVTTFGTLPELTMVAPVMRGQAEAATTARPILEPLIGALPPHDGTTDRDPAAAEAYLVALQEAIADGWVSAPEVAALADVATRHGLTSDELRDLHQELVLGLIDTALTDRRITKEERAEIERIAAWLNVDVSQWDAMVRAARTRIKAAVEEYRSEVAGKTIAFAGVGIHKPNIREALAAKHGFSYATRVTNDTDFLVIGTTHTETHAVEKARQLGVPMMVEATFWQRLGEV
jgi:DNA polymerase-3 subunit epsilon